MTSDFGIQFENWLCFTLPWQLNLTPSKEVAVKTKFSPFADYVRPLANKAPKEFEMFFEELRKRFSQVPKWRIPRGSVVSFETYKDQWLKYPNGKFRHTLVEKI